MDVDLRYRVAIARLNNERGCIKVERGSRKIRASWRSLTANVRDELIWDRGFGPGIHVLLIMERYDPEHLLLFEVILEEDACSHTQLVPHLLMAEEEAKEFIAKLKDGRVECIEDMKKKGML